MVDDELAKSTVVAKVWSKLSWLTFDMESVVLVRVRGAVRIMVNQGLDKAARPQTKLPCSLITCRIR